MNLKGENMIIKKLKIKQLYGIYNYDVSFNSDLTFLYGTNGCGKTTILNIIESIISGRIYNLFSLEFESIKLFYFSPGNTKTCFNVSINKKNERIIVIYKEAEHVLEKEYFIRNCDEAESSDELFYLMSLKYSFLSDIQKEFNFIYLPLNRNTLNKYSFDQFNSRRYKYRLNYNYDFGLSREEEIGRAADIVQKSYMQAYANVSAINDDFRNSVLKSLVETTTKVSNTDFVNSIIESEDSSINDLEKNYLKLLESLELLDESERQKCETFYASYRDLVNKIKSNNNSDDYINSVFLFLYYFHEIEKIKTIIPLAKKAESNKEDALKKVNLFIDVMNSFICLNDSEKKLYIDQTGKIVFRSEDGVESNISIDNLSSGEKQLLIFFAYLIFKVDDSKTSVFVVDEPELSLHLSWQKIFVEKAMNVNNNMQLIFATHSPEIIGPYRRKMIKLQKEHIKIQN